MKFRVKAYGDEVNDTLANSHECGSTLWGTEDGPIAGSSHWLTARPMLTLLTAYYHRTTRKTDSATSSDMG